MSAATESKVRPDSAPEPCTGTARPNLFIVGAPRCGTTSMHGYLDQHPDIFMSPVKEPLHFGRELYSDGWPTIRNRNDYLRLFEKADREDHFGESTPWYLYSRTASGEIHEFSPSARILIMLRNPVDTMYSLHRKHVLDGFERIADFEQALVAQEERRETSTESSPSRDFRFSVSLRDVVGFADQVERYLREFGHARVRIVLFEDLRADPQATYRDILRFIGVRDDVAVDLQSRNEGRAPRSKTLNAACNAALGQLGAVAPGRRPSVARRALTKMKALNATATVPPMPAAVRRRLTEECRPDIERLSRLMDRDLSPWLA